MHSRRLVDVVQDPSRNILHVAVVDNDDCVLL